jgi:integrase/recombinase XerD
MMVRQAGRLVGCHLRFHDLRRHAAAVASRSGTPIEIVSEMIMRPAHLSATPRYLGKVTDVEAMLGTDNLYG